MEMIRRIGAKNVRPKLAATMSKRQAAEGLECENAKLKKLLADTMLDNTALKDLLAKKW
jgi:hypothetical protein